MRRGGLEGLTNVDKVAGVVEVPQRAAELRSLFLHEYELEERKHSLSSR